MARAQREHGGCSTGGNGQLLLLPSTVRFLTITPTNSLLGIQILSWSPQTQAGEMNGLAFPWCPRSPRGPVSDGD